MTRRRWIAIAAAASLAGGCESLIGAGFDDYGVTPADGPSTSTATGSTTSSTAGGGDGGGDGGAPPTTTSSSSGTTCTEWPSGAGEWVWATQLGGDEDGLTALRAHALVPTDSDVYPWAIVGQFLGTLFGGTDDEVEATRPSPFVAPIGEEGVDPSTATWVACSGTCTEVKIRDASADRPTWAEFGVSFWAGGSFSGEFQDLDADFSDAPFIARFYADENTDAWSPDTTWTSTLDGEVELGRIDAVSADSALVAFAGVGREMTLFGLSEVQEPRFWVGVGLGRYPLLLAKRAGYLGSGVFTNECDDTGDAEHEHQLDVALRGETAWVAGRYCGQLVFDSAIGNEPGDGFVARLDVPEAAENGGQLLFDDAPSLVHGSPALAVASEDAARAFLVGEVDPEDLTKSIPGDSSIFATSRDVWVARVDHGDGGLTAGWSVQLDLPGEQHVHDVAVRRHGGDDDDVDVFVVGTSSERIDLNGFSASCAPIDGQIGFVASLAGLDGSIRWIRSFGRADAAALEIAPSDRGIVIVGAPGAGAPTLSPTADGGPPIPLGGSSTTLFAGELTR